MTLSTVAATSITELPLGQAQRSSHRCRHTRCSVSSQAGSPDPLEARELRAANQAGFPGYRFATEQKRGSGGPARSWSSC